MKWHQKKSEEVFEVLKTSREGLPPEEARVRLSHYGPNELKEKEKKTPFMMFLDQFKDFMILILVAAAVISGGDWRALRYPGDYCHRHPECHHRIPPGVQG